MDTEQLRALQSPIKRQYREDPQAAQVHLHSSGDLNPEKFAYRVATAGGNLDAGLHPAAGGDGLGACSGDMLLDALVACAGVTLRAVATSMSITLKRASINAQGDMDFRGTLGVDKQVPIGITDIRLNFDIDADADEQQIAKLIELTERYCVIYQTLTDSPNLITTHERK